MGSFLPTGNALIDGLERRASRYSEVLAPGKDQAITLLSAIFLLADRRGLTCTMLTEGTPDKYEVVSVSDEVLSITGTDDLADFKLLQQSPDFIRASDIDMAITNTANRTSAPHVLGVKKKSGGYTDVRINSYWVTLPSDQPGVRDQQFRLSTWVKATLAG